MKKMTNKKYKVLACKHYFINTGDGARRKFCGVHTQVNPDYSWNLEELPAEWRGRI